MLDVHWKNDAERLTGLPGYPLLRPDDVNECRVYQVVSEFKPDTGLADVSSITQRYQFKIISPSRLKTIETEKLLLQAGAGLANAQIDGYPVQYVASGGFTED
ncbi:hypothetical protein J2R62_18425 [Plesiomonas shigelloides]|uniref:Uncharacterized protein n=1 Tax=Plesiomonas shigelloides TaxID=703 RepID=A0A8I2B6L2_PLESH|nr:hypothetical protein [Plesiomonas shigelloides]MBO1110095.1 hypothetical protein [Plesiomonas shigelloides]